MTYPFAFTVTLVGLGGATGEDAYGNDTFTPARTSVPGAVFAPGGSTELLAGGDTVTTQPTVYLPAGTVVDAVDQVIVPGFGAFEVDGEPASWPSSPFTGWQPSNSVVVRLRKVTG